MKMDPDDVEVRVDCRAVRQKGIYLHLKGVTMSRMYIFCSKFFKLKPTAFRNDIIFHYSIFGLKITCKSIS
jgi:hypothetical protein